MNTTFQILTDAEIDAQKAKVSMNALLKNFAPKICKLSDGFTSGYIDLYPLRNIYMSASGIGNFNTMTIAGDRNIIKKIPINAESGDVIFNQVVAGMDYLDCSRQTLSQISFQLKDIFGRIINLHDNHISFSIVFSRVNSGS